MKNKGENNVLVAFVDDISLSASTDKNLQVLNRVKQYNTINGTILNFKKTKVLMGVKQNYEERLKAAFAVLKIAPDQS